MTPAHTIKYSRRAKYMRLTVRSADEVIVTVPFGMDSADVERFVLSKATWLAKAIESMRRRGPVRRFVGTRNEYLRLKEQARAVVMDRVQYFAAFYGLSYGRISIRNQKSCWGSCSRRGNLNFNYRLLHVSPELRDYVVVHEICHLKQFNHSSAFWDLVGQACPEYRALRTQARRYFV